MGTVHPEGPITERFGGGLERLSGCFTKGGDKSNTKRRSLPDANGNQSRFLRESIPVVG